MLQWIRNSAIDRQKWDHCINTCQWGNVYALTSYLDLLTQNNWEALVYGDYEMIMPVPLRKKLSITYTYRPDFCQQLGVFALQNTISENILNLFYIELSKKCSHIVYPLNFQNACLPLKGLNFKKRTNFTLKLDGSYQALYENFSGDLKRNLLKSSKAALIIKRGIEANLVVNLYKETWNHLHYISDEGYSHFEQLFTSFSKKAMSESYGVFQKDKLMAACIILKHKNRIYYPFSAISKEGRKLGAAAFMIDSILHEHEGSGLLFDFEGSDLESVNFFYKKFNPVNEPYYQMEKTFGPWAIIHSVLKRRR